MKRALSALLLVVVVAAGVVAGLAFFTARDQSTVATPQAGPGRPAGELPAGVEQPAPGNVLLVASDPDELEALRDLGDRVAGEPTEALRAAGQAVLVEEATGVEGVRAFAAGRTVRASGADDPALREFVEAWLGRVEG
ncbi:MAG TPA: hypothetical protein VGV36_01620 [Solirubrobacteraceae bacterium]|nr:hypothetical protein [Solirubrobacteraceae bacterium]